MVEPVKDPDNEYPVPSVLRPAFRELVEAFRAGDSTVDSSIPMVEAVDARTAKQILEYLEDYGETLAPLPDESWDTSVSRWMNGYWDVLVDLWTEESGRSDLVVSARVSEEGTTFRIRIFGVYVP